MTTHLPIVADITRVRAEVYPDVYVEAGADLTGHTAHLVVIDEDGDEIDRVAGVVTVLSADSSTITFTPSAAMVATTYAAATATYSVILDIASEAARRTIATGDWIVADYPG